MDDEKTPDKLHTQIHPCTDFNNPQTNTSVLNTENNVNVSNWNAETLNEQSVPVPGTNLSEIGLHRSDSPNRQDSSVTSTNSVTSGNMSAATRVDVIPTSVSGSDNNLIAEYNSNWNSDSTEILNEQDILVPNIDLFHRGLNSSSSSNSPEPSVVSINRVINATAATGLGIIAIGSLNINPRSGMQISLRYYSGNQRTNPNTRSDNEVTRVVNSAERRAQEGARRAFDSARRSQEGARRMQDGARRMQEGARRMQEGPGRMQEGARRLQEGARRMQESARRMQEGPGRMQEGARRLQDGARRMQEGARRMQEGARRMQEGPGRMEEGARRLQEGATRTQQGGRQALNDARGAHEFSNFFDDFQFISAIEESSSSEEDEDIFQLIEEISDREEDEFSDIEDVGSIIALIEDSEEEDWDAEPQGLSDSEINRLPTRKYTGTNVGAAENSLKETDSEHEIPENCIVCLTRYDTGDILKRLPCFHEFHSHCIDQWLVRNRQCPLCKVSSNMSGN